MAHYHPVKPIDLATEQIEGYKEIQILLYILHMVLRKITEQNLQQVFQHLEQFGLHNINLSKCHILWFTWGTE